jgi:transglutaminase-like putative cysteine protease
MSARRRIGVLLLCAVAALAVLPAACSRHAAANAPTAASLQQAVAKAPCVVQADLPGIEAVAPGASHLGQMGAGSNAGGALGGELGGGGTASPAPSPAASPQSPCVDPEVGDMIADLTAMGNAVPAAEIDVGARAKALPSDVPSIFAFVRDRVRLDAYNGAMRGPLGTLMGLAGNPTDKALLLAELLRDKGLQVRFARGTLSDDEVRQLAGLVRAPTPAQSPEPLPHPIATPKGFDEAQTDKTVQSLRDAYAKRMQDDIATAQSQAGKLADTLASRSVVLGSSAPTDWTPMFRTHYWVQVQQGDAWVDLDPSSPDLAVGKHLGRADTSFSATSLPDSEYVTVGITLSQDRIANGQPKDGDILSIRKNAADLFAQRLQLIIKPGDKTTKIGDATSLVPQINFGGDVTKGDAIDVSDAGESQLQTLRLQIEVQTPGQPPSTYQRVLFSRQAGQNAQAVAYGVAGNYEFLVVPAELNGTFEAYKALLEMVNQQSAYAWADAAVRGTAGTKLPVVRPELFPIELVQYARRDWIFAQQLGNAQPKPVRFYYDRPDIVMLHRGYRAVGKQTAAVIAYDIFDNGMAAVGDDARASARANLARGYMDTSLEQRTLAAGPAVDTPKVMDAASKAGIATTVVTADAAQSAQALGLPPAVQTSLQATLDAGQVAIIPERPVMIDGQQQIGWLAIDPRSGNEIGRMSTGGGQALTETVIEEANTVYTEAEALEYYNSIFSCIAHGVTAPLAGKEGAEAGHQFVSCMALAMCKMGASLLIDEYIEEHHSFIVAIYKGVAFHYELGHPALCGAVLGEGGGGE